MLNHNAMWALMSWDVVMMNCWHSSWLFSFPLLPLPLCAFYTRILRQAHGITIAIQLESPTATQPWKLAPHPPVCTRWLSVRPPGPACASARGGSDNCGFPSPPAAAVCSDCCPDAAAYEQNRCAIRQKECLLCARLRSEARRRKAGGNLSYHCLSSHAIYL